MYSLLAYQLIGFCFLVCYSMETLHSIQIGYNMTSKKTPPVLTETTRPEQTGNRLKKLIAMALLLILIVIAYFVWPRPLPNTSTLVKETPTESEHSEADTLPANMDSVSIEDTDSDLSTNEVTEPTGIEIPDSEAILNASLPETDSLAKEEVDRLEDERQRMAEQEKLASEQVQMNKKLTDMKAEQIKLLEQQIAQLEAAQTPQ